MGKIRMTVTACGVDRRCGREKILNFDTSFRARMHNIG